MSATRKVVFCLNGTISVGPNSPQSWLGLALSYFMYDANNSIIQIFQNCKADAKKHVDGPGTDFCNDEDSKSTLRKLAGTIGGCINGHWGINGLDNQLKKVLAEITHQINLAKAENKKIALHFFTWSRGSFLAFMVLKSLAQAIPEYKNYLDDIYFYNIDPVVGGPLDRWYFANYLKQQNPDLNIHVYSFFSNTGNLEPWPFKFNTPFFSGFSFLGNTEDSISFIAKGGSHLGVANHYSSHESGKLVLAKIVEIAQINGLEFDSQWKEKVKKEGTHAHLKLIKQPSPTITRKILSMSSPFWGSPVEVKKLLPLHKNYNLLGPSKGKELVDEPDNLLVITEEEKLEDNSEDKKII